MVPSSIRVQALVWVQVFGDHPRVVAVLVEPYLDQPALFATRETHPDANFPAEWVSLTAALTAGWKIESVAATEGGDTIKLYRYVPVPA